jgi:hypothetical protein
MRKVILAILVATVFFASCKKDDVVPGVLTVNVELKYPSGSGFTAQEGVTVKMTSVASSYEAKTDVNGKAVFTLPVGVYEASATDARSANGTSFVFNGVKAGVAVAANWVATDVVALELQKSQRSQVIIKEIFVGGTLRDDGSGTFTYDRYMILYNNSDVAANLGNLCLGLIAPYNAQASNGYIPTGGTEPTYVAEGWIPAAQAFWYFQQNVTLEPGKQIVIALANAVNNTLTYSKSINFDNSAYYVTYDIAQFSHAATHVTPAASIPTSHYLKTAKYGAGTAWGISVTSPGVFLFNPENTTPAAFGANTAVESTITGYVSRKVPTSWVVDAVDAFLLNNVNNKKRFPATIDAGYVYHLNGAGYSIYRNVDKTATEAVATNAGKIVYNYNFGTTSIGAGGTTDPSGIDAEASIKAGARIVYKDDNNSTVDFHLRSQASLRN